MAFTFWIKSCTFFFKLRGHKAYHDGHLDILVDKYSCIFMNQTFYIFLQHFLYSPLYLGYKLKTCYFNKYHGWIYDLWILTYLLWFTRPCLTLIMTRGVDLTQSFFNSLLKNILTQLSLFKTFLNFFFFGLLPFPLSYI